MVVCATVAVGGRAASARAQEADAPAVGLRLVADGFSSPVTLVSAGDGSGRRFVVDRVGLVRVIGSDGTLEPEPFLDLRSRILPPMADLDERGLLGLAFHPRYASNGRCFVRYSAPLRAGAPAGYDHTSRVSEFRVSATDPNRADPGSERIVLRVDEPQLNHNGGTVLFGSTDGSVYILLGDGWGSGRCRARARRGLVCGQRGRQDIEQNLLGFGQDPAGEMYVLTIDQTGPTGTTGEVYRLVRPSG